MQEYKKKRIEEEEKKMQELIASGAFKPGAGGEPSMLGAKDDDDLFG